jgi:hypothetical protein
MNEIVRISNKSETLAIISGEVEIIRESKAVMVTLPVNDVNVQKHILAFGNKIEIDDINWVGYIDTPREWYKDTIKIFAYIDGYFSR